MSLDTIGGGGNRKNNLPWSEMGYAAYSKKYDDERELRTVSCVLPKGRSRDHMEFIIELVGRCFNPTELKFLLEHVGAMQTGSANFKLSDLDGVESYISKNLERDLEVTLPNNKYTNNTGDL